MSTIVTTKKEVENVEINCCSQVVDVTDKDIFFALWKKSFVHICDLWEEDKLDGSVDEEEKEKQEKEQKQQ